MKPLNKKQRYALAIGIAIILIMAIFPPWMDTPEKPSKFGFFLTPPMIEEENRPYPYIDLSRLTFEWTVVFVGLGITLTALKTKTKK